LTSVWHIGYCENPALPTTQLLHSLGFGSTLGNGRWHSKGQLQVVYAGSSRGLCQLEKRVHCNGATPKNQALMRLDIGAEAALLEASDWGLQSDWRNDEASTQSLGMQWLASGTSLGLWVPSYVEPAERNLLLNPAHPHYRDIALVLERNPFVFDPRLFAK
jgi:RES domain-containing protein